jgi:hypothetical protein
MSYQKFQKVSPEDLASFFARLMNFYGETEEKSYLSFRQDVIVILRLFRAHYHEDLIDDIITRVILKTSEMERKGEPILDFKAYSRKVAWFVIQEENKKTWKSAQSLTPDDQESGAFKPFEPRSQVEDEIQKIESEIRHQCYEDCLDRHPEMRELVLGIYPDEQLSWEELARRRERLAEKLLGDPRKKNTLEVRVFRFRSKALDDCVRECTTSTLSQHPELERLYQQQMGKGS